MNPQNKLFWSFLASSLISYGIGYFIGNSNAKLLAFPKNSDPNSLNPKEYVWEVAKNPKNFNKLETYLVSKKNPSEKYLAFNNPLTDKKEIMPYESVWYNVESPAKSK